MYNFVGKELCPNVWVRNFTDPKFKTMRISINIILPLTKESVSASALLPALVSRATKEYPCPTQLSKRLAELYGASVDSGVSKIGDTQVLSISASGISGAYALEGEDLTKELAQLLCSAVFSPLVDEDKQFPEDSFNQERRQLLETIDAEYNDKKIYAREKCQEIMFGGEPAGISRYGQKPDVLGVQRDSLIDRWHRILETGRIEIFALGNCDYDTVLNCFDSCFEFQRKPAPLQTDIVLKAGEPREQVESLPIAQSKLVMGFRTGVRPEDAVPTRLMCVLFGGSASSKLFLNVREKMSLCYYCSAGLNLEKSAMFVQSGVETVNVEKARAAILEQLRDICDGDFTDEDMTFAKLAMVNSFQAVGDSLYATESWYLNQAFSREVLTPEEIAEKIQAVSRQEVIEAAKKVSLDTVFVLKGEIKNA